MVTPVTTGVARDALLVAGADVLWIRDALHALEQRARTDGGCAPARLRALLEMVDEVARRTVAALVADSATDGHALVRGSIDVIGTNEAAVMLCWTERHVRRQCMDGALESARKRAGRWTVDRSEVLSLLAERGAAAG